MVICFSSRKCLMFILIVLCMFLRRSSSCLEREREILLDIKAFFIHPNQTSKASMYIMGSWQGQYCCSWVGVECENRTSHVVVLNLDFVQEEGIRGGYLNATLFVGLEQLRSLSLVSNSMGGLLPIKELSRLRNLQRLVLRANSFEGVLPMEIGLLSSLQVLDLGTNRLSGSIPSSLGNLSHLRVLDLRGNQFRGSIPPFLSSLLSLEGLYLSNNQLQGSIPRTFGNWSSLTVLALSGNRLSGPIPRELGKLQNLAELYLSNNSLSNNFSFSTIVHLSKLRYVDLSLNTRLVILDTNVIPSFQLSELRLSFCDMSKFNLSVDGFLSTQRILETIDFSYSKLAGIVPTWLIESVNENCYLRGNMLGGSISSPIVQPNLTRLDLSINNISGEIPKDFFAHLPSLSNLNISHNFLRGSIDSSIGSSGTLVGLDLSFNQLSGKLPLNLSDKLLTLDLSNNNLSGTLPPNLTSGRAIWYLKLSRNNLEGSLLSQNFYLPNLQSLHLDHNAFHGTVPENLLLYSPTLTVLNIGYNYLSGEIPREIGKLPNLQVLIFKENQFEGNIPHELCELQQLAILDLSLNNLQGAIPPCFNNNSAWVNGTSAPITYIPIENGEWNYVEVVYFDKGNEYGYSGLILSLLTGIDLSSNQISGPIPMEMGLLKGLIVLNISNNHLTGIIPNSFSQLQDIEALDLSQNKLTGRLPPSLSLLTFLGIFSIADNDIEGRVPTDGHLSTFGESSYVGNPKLCGFAGKACYDQVSSVPQGDEDNEDAKSGWEGNKLVLYGLIAVGFTVGFWGALAFVFLNKKWGIMCFEAMDEVIHHLLWKCYPIPKGTFNLLPKP
ncbi:hypothetical protein AMTRI_Chr10g1620 [Amborella trichopoda]